MVNWTTLICWAAIVAVACAIFYMCQKRINNHR